MTSEEINKVIEDLDGGTGPYNFDGTGKAIPYIGWFWRSVDFDKPFPIGHIKYSGSAFEPDADWIGFMENNKWGYDERLVTEEERVTIRHLCEEIAKDPTAESCKALCDFMQELRI